MPRARRLLGGQLSIELLARNPQPLDRIRRREQPLADRLERQRRSERLRSRLVCVRDWHARQPPDDVRGRLAERRHDPPHRIAKLGNSRHVERLPHAKHDGRRAARDNGRCKRECTHCENRAVRAVVLSRHLRRRRRHARRAAAAEGTDRRGGRLGSLHWRGLGETRDARRMRIAQTAECRDIHLAEEREWTLDILLRGRRLLRRRRRGGVGHTGTWPFHASCHAVDVAQAAAAQEIDGRTSDAREESGCTKARELLRGELRLPRALGLWSLRVHGWGGFVCMRVRVWRRDYAKHFFAAWRELPWVTMSARLPRVLVVDHYDSYTRNLLSLLSDAALPTPSSDELAARVVVIPHTHPALAPENFAAHLLPHVDALILSPGPGNPANDDDFGTSAALLRAPHLVQVPILGICLGMQGLATTFGGAVRRLTRPVHGTKRALEIVRDASCLMDGIADGTEVVCYNSLVVDEHTLPPCLRVSAWSQTESDGRVVQGVQHTSLPYFGVQFHPESVESSGGDLLLRNFLAHVAAYWGERDPRRVALWNSSACAIPHELHAFGESLVSLGHHAAHEPRDSSRAWRLVEHTFRAPAQTLDDAVAHTLPALAALFRTDGCIWLDSASAHNPQSRFSFVSTPAFTVSHGMDGALDACVRRDAHVAHARIDMDGASLWDWLDQVQGALQDMTQGLDTATANDAHCPFRTGFAGFFSYEMKDASLGLHCAQGHYEAAAGAVDRMQLPLAQWAFCNTVLCFDHRSCTWTGYALVRTEEPMYGAGHAPLSALARAVHAADARTAIGTSEACAASWFERVQRALDQAEALNTGPTEPPKTILPPLRALDGKAIYQDRIRQAQEFIGQGESYELCLTTQFEGTLPELAAATDKYAAYFDLYCKLRRRNPAPFGAYIELLPTADGTPQAILSTSPERFLTITRDGGLEMRPIKGTLARPGHAAGEGTWLEQAKTDPAMRAFVEEEDERRKRQLNGDPKERGENLMIADLIRADLQSICFPASVKVLRLIAIETYETVHQLVTSVVGQMRPGIRSVEAVGRCFPPGSMTGAPKKRSVQLLEQLERTPDCRESEATRRRGVYSGALGFIGVDGGTNLSVVIRTLTAQGAGVTVGAGGAVTFLSTPEGEWTEVLHKLGSLTTMAE